jgi:hypothetical protein
MKNGNISNKSCERANLKSGFLFQKSFSTMNQLNSKGWQAFNPTNLFLKNLKKTSLKNNA